MTTEKPKKTLLPQSLRYGNFLTELRHLLASGEWTSLSAAQLTSVHDVDNGTMRYMADMGLIERRRDVAKRGTTLEYKATGKLSEVMTFQLIEGLAKLREEAYERERKNKFAPRQHDVAKEFQKEEIPPIEFFSPADNQPEPATNEPFVRVMEEPTNTDWGMPDPPAKPVPIPEPPKKQYFWVAKETKLMDAIFNSEEEAEAYIEKEAGPNQKFTVLEVKSVISTTIKLNKTKL